MSSILLWLLTTGLMAIGFIGIFVPLMPGIGIIFAGILLYAYVTQFTSISVATVIVLGVVAVLAWLADYYGSAVGAKLGGGKRYAAVGSVAGAVMGVFMSGPPGLILGAFSGALLGAVAEGQKIGTASRIALWSVLGTVGATIVQALLGIALIISFVIAVFI